MTTSGFYVTAPRRKRGALGADSGLRPYSAAASPEIYRRAKREWTRPGPDVCSFSPVPPERQARMVQHRTPREDFGRKRDFVVRHGTARADIRRKRDFIVRHGTAPVDICRKRDFIVLHGTARADIRRKRDFVVRHGTAGDLFGCLCGNKRGGFRDRKGTSGAQEMTKGRSCVWSGNPAAG